MDLWAVHVKNSSRSPVWLKQPISSSCNLRKIAASFRFEDGRVFEINYSTKRTASLSVYHHRSFVVRANNSNSSSSPGPASGLTVAAAKGGFLNAILASLGKIRLPSGTRVGHVFARHFGFREARFNGLPLFVGETPRVIATEVISLGDRSLNAPNPHDLPKVWRGPLSNVSITWVNHTTPPSTPPPVARANIQSSHYRPRDPSPLSRRIWTNVVRDPPQSRAVVARDAREAREIAEVHVPPSTTMPRIEIHANFDEEAVVARTPERIFGNGDHSIPEEDGHKGNNSSSERNKSNDTGSEKSHPKALDWREFRAALFAQEQAATGGSDNHMQDGSALESKPLGLKWAHPISSPETGCVLVATEKLDGVRTFERTVVLLLRSGTRHPQEGPFGVVINRPLHKKIKHMKPTNLDLATTFADCSLHFGGPLEASMFLLRALEKSHHHGLEEVIPGLCFGARNSLDEAAGLVKKGVLKPHNFRFFVGYAGWQLDQLREEIESGYWYVAACSSNLIFGGSPNSSSEGLWQEILQIMGGQYSELSRKPKQDM